MQEVRGEGMKPMNPMNPMKPMKDTHETRDVLLTLRGSSWTRISLHGKGA